MSDRNTIPPTLMDLLIKLGYLAEVPAQNKACFNDLSYVESKGWYQMYKRFKKGENRKNMLAKINQTIDQSIEEIDRYNGTQFLPLLVTKLANTEIGINNLIDTYHDDPGVTLPLGVCKTKIETKLKPFRKLIEPKVDASVPILKEGPKEITKDKSNIEPDDLEL